MVNFQELRKEIEKGCGEWFKSFGKGRVGVDTQHILEIYEAINNNGYDSNNYFYLVEKPSGDKANKYADDCEEFKYIEVWLDQTVNGGYSGDSYEGNAYIKIKEGLYLTFGWWC